MPPRVAFYALLTLLRALTPSAAAGQDTLPWRAYSLPLDHSRGTPAAAFRGTPEELVAVYTAATLVYLQGRPPARFYLDQRYLPDTADYGTLPLGDSTILASLAARSGFGGICDSREKGACERVGGQVLTLSKVYRIGPDSVRTFILHQALTIDTTFPFGFAAEDVFLVTRHHGQWRVVGRRNRMIT